MSATVGSRASPARPVAAALLLVVAAACGEREVARQAAGSVPGLDAAPAPPADAAAAATPPAGEPPPSENATPPEPVEHDDVVVALGAVRAWQAVVDRAALLERRGSRGVVYGRVGGPIASPAAGSAAPGAVAPGAAAGSAAAGSAAGSAAPGEAAPGAPDAPPPDDGVRWLIDPTEGDGALAIRVRFPGTPPAPGARVAVRGAWVLDDARRWTWRADEVIPLPPDDDGDAAAAAAGAAAPGLVLRAGAPTVPRRPIDKAAPGDVIDFVVTTLPVRPGDGWAISDQQWGAVLAYLLLPGERESYGGHDMRSDDERWRLRRHGWYWVKVGKVRRKPGEPVVITAAGPPVRYP